MRSFSAALIAVFLALANARGQWAIVSTQSNWSPGRVVEHRQVEVADASSGTRATLDLAIFSARNATLRVIDNPEANDSLGAAMPRERCLAGVNGGYFSPEFTPIGLMISDGHLIAPQQKARLLSGVVSAARDRVLVQRAAEFSMKVRPLNARQCGPFLLDRGQAVPGLNDERSARRTFVATSSSGDRAAIGYCSYVTLAQLAAVLALPELKLQRAMNLDGGSSSGFWFAGEDGVVSIREQKTVRDFLGVVAK